MQALSDLEDTMRLPMMTIIAVLSLLGGILHGLEVSQVALSHEGLKPCQFDPHAGPLILGAGKTGR